MTKPTKQDKENVFTGTLGTPGTPGTPGNKFGIVRSTGGFKSKILSTNGGVIISNKIE